MQSLTPRCYPMTYLVSCAMCMHDYSTLRQGSLLRNQYSSTGTIVCY